MSTPATPPASTPASTPRRKKAARPQFTSTILVLEAVLVLFAALAAHGLRLVPTAVLWTVAGTVAVVLVLLSRFVAAPGGYVAGSLAQLLVVGGGLLLPMMYVVGGVFAVLWLVAYRLGGRIDRERAAWDAAHPPGA